MSAPQARQLPGIGQHPVGQSSTACALPPTGNACPALPQHPVQAATPPHRTCPQKESRQKGCRPSVAVGARRGVPGESQVASTSASYRELFPQIFHLQRSHSHSHGQGEPWVRHVCQVSRPRLGGPAGTHLPQGSTSHPSSLSRGLSSYSRPPWWMPISPTSSCTPGTCSSPRMAPAPRGSRWCGCSLPCVPQDGAPSQGQHAACLSRLQRPSQTNTLQHSSPACPPRPAPACSALLRPAPPCPAA